MPSPLPRLRKICLSFPEAHEVEAWGEPTWRVKGKMFAMYAADGNHHGSGRASVWVKSDKENQALMIGSQPDTFFKPPYVGPSGWVGVYLDRSPDWNEVTAILRDGWKMIAPKRVVAASEAPQKTRARRANR
ncbi:MAG TPA: MmcQ/YjbR family DNA-binding protein [Gemmatimonadaceae bacterium]